MKVVTLDWTAGALSVLNNHECYSLLYRVGLSQHTDLNKWHHFGQCARKRVPHN
jgi:hypothetical protein